MNRATPAFLAIAARSVRAACAFICSTSALRWRVHVLEEALDERRVAVLGRQRRQHLHVPPRRAVRRPLHDAVDVGLHRTAAPALAARRQLDVDAALRRPADEQRVGFREQIRVIADELAQADVHPLLVALGHEDQIHRQLAHHRLHRRDGVQHGHLAALGVGGAAADDHARRVRRRPPSGRPRSAPRTAARSSRPAASPASCRTASRWRASSARPRRTWRRRPDCPGCRIR